MVLSTISPFLYPPDYIEFTILNNSLYLKLKPNLQEVCDVDRNEKVNPSLARACP